MKIEEVKYDTKEELVAALSGKKMTCFSEAEVKEALKGETSGVLTLIPPELDDWHERIEIRVDTNGCFVDLEDYTAVNRIVCITPDACTDGIYNLIAERIEYACK